MQSRLRRGRGARQRDGGEQCRHTHAMQATGNALSIHWGAFAPSLLGGQALPSTPTVQDTPEQEARDLSPGPTSS